MFYARKTSFTHSGWVRPFSLDAVKYNVLRAQNESSPNYDRYGLERVSPFPYGGNIMFYALKTVRAELWSARTQKSHADIYPTHLEKEVTSYAET